MYIKLQNPRSCLLWRENGKWKMQRSNRYKVSYKLYELECNYNYNHNYYYYRYNPWDSRVAEDKSVRGRRTGTGLIRQSDDGVVKIVAECRHAVRFPQKTVDRTHFARSADVVSLPPLKYLPHSFFLINIRTSYQSSPFFLSVIALIRDSFYQWQVLSVRC